MLEETQLGAESFNYIRSQLALGKTLAKNILKHHKIGSGRSFAYLLPDTPTTKVAQFNGSVLDAKSNSWQPRADFITRFLKSNKRSLVVFENAYAIPADTWIQSKGDSFKFFYFQSEVYLFLTAQDQTAEKVIASAKMSSGYPSIGILTTLPDEVNLIQNHQKVTEEFLDQLAKNSEHLLIGAYDNETHIIWSRATAPIMRHVSKEKVIA